MVDEERYDINAKVTKNEGEVSTFYKCTDTCILCLTKLQHFKVMWVVGVLFVLEKDTGPVPEDLWVEGQDEETEPEEGEGVCWCHAGRSAGR